MDHSPQPLHISVGGVHDRHLDTTHQNQPKLPAVQNNHIHIKTGSAVIFSDSQDRQLSREFAEQFHESVLQSTRQKEMTQKMSKHV